MAKTNSSLLSLQFFLFLFLCLPFFSLASLHKTTNLLSKISLGDNPPNQYFEVTKPIIVPKTKPCSHLILQHDFGFTYGKPPVLANYSPPSHCPSQAFTKIVLEWKATCKGNQYDRIFGVWLGGVELLRGCTAEPTESGIEWSVEKDVTRYYSLLVKKETQTLAVYLDGLWYEIVNSSDTKLKEFKMPQNVYRAVLEVYISFHEKDEFWYANPPNDYIDANDLKTPGNGPFREVLVSLDGRVVGAVWPFTIIYTGGIYPLFWIPISGIGSFSLPSYDIEITPFLGNILDGKPHKLGFSVTNAQNIWFIDANLHLWLDTRSTKTEAKLLKYNCTPLFISTASRFKGLNGMFKTTANRSISATGWVKSSFGKITTTTFQQLSFNNAMELENDGDFQAVNQTIHFNAFVTAELPNFYYIHAMESLKTFPLTLFFNILDIGNETIVSVANVSLGFNEEKYEKGAGFRALFSSSLKNLQSAESALVLNGNLILSNYWGTQQVYKYHGNDLCYLRNISSLRNSIVYDKVGNICDQGEASTLGMASI
ncbi:hypothetical protein SLEP1_g14577 [Rubroshorea leprosula]|uniref:Peptide N-acetyl-beta-D-glucosaminyl asparaginase amidase A N-terminal domain-containing protein n=1 Tax=Rubroshorea leprosula TaxID=152421 RepID=A0AAV5IQG3_9ROSI|nr:hypothetical protein SLEP1_g14577 [Rubroshorea leprosula]